MDKESICLDTTILIDFYRKKNKSKTQFVKPSKDFHFSISVITKLEVLAGVNLGQRTFWEQVFKRMEILPLAEEDVEVAAKIIRALKKKNKIIGLKDILIASSAIANGLRLCTLNLKDFQRIEELGLLITER